MTVRMSTFSAYERGLNQLQMRQAELSSLQEEMTSGKRVARPSDDPAAAARAERALAALSRTEADRRALDASRNAMAQAESALGDASELMQRIREQTLAAGNPTFTDAERRSLAQDIRGLRDQLLAVANRGNGAGGYLFGGQGSTQTPFVDAPGGVAYRGDGGALMTATAEPLPLSVDGGRAWLGAPDPGTGTPTLSVFDVLDRLAGELETAGRTNDEITDTVRVGVQGLDASMDHLGSVRSGLGGALNSADGFEVRLSREALAAEADRSAAEDADMVKVVSEFQNQQTGYDAALKAYSMVQRLSLFDYVSG
ncbi:MAG: flagellar hook-associated protein FlgL [Burkholderiaceae bacterium]|nr:flagellar hook-associated protein FlgL [Burkholderiaceae bacterium]